MRVLDIALEAVLGRSPLTSAILFVVFHTCYSPSTSFGDRRSAVNNLALQVHGHSYEPRSAAKAPLQPFARACKAYIYMALVDWLSSGLMI